MIWLALGAEQLSCNPPSRSEFARATGSGGWICRADEWLTPRAVGPLKGQTPFLTI